MKTYEKATSMVTDHDWSIGQTYTTRDGKTWRVTRLESTPIGVLPWVIQVADEALDINHTM